MSGKFEIQLAGPEDHTSLISFFRKYDFALKEKDWYEWKYMRNPFGKAKSILCLRDGDIVGTVSVLPQKFTFSGRTYSGIQPVDGLLGMEARGKKVFSELMGRALETRPDASSPPLFYLAFPGPAASVRATMRAGFAPLIGGRNLSFILHPDYFRKKKGSALVGKILSPVLMLFRSHVRSQADGAIRVVEIHEFHDRHIPPSDESRVCGVRTAAFLNWRVFSNPKDEMRAFVLEDEKGVQGYLVVKCVGRTLEVIDYRFSAPHPGVLAAYLTHVLDNDLGDSVDFIVLGDHSHMALLPSWGYLRRKFKGMMFVSGARECGLPGDEGKWDITLLDSDW